MTAHFMNNQNLHAGTLGHMVEKEMLLFNDALPTHFSYV